MQKHLTPTSNTHQMTVKERLTLFAKFKEKSVRAFEIKSNLTVGYVNAIRVSIQPDKIQRIASQYPDLNTEWLITGNGPMLKNLPEDSDSSALINEKERIISMLEAQVKMLQAQIEIKDGQIKELLKQRAADGAKDTTSAMAG